jgi:hypothetical protein
MRLGRPDRSGRLLRMVSGELLPFKEYPSHGSRRCLLFGILQMPLTMIRKSK